LGLYEPKLDWKVKSDAIFLALFTDCRPFSKFVGIEKYVLSVWIIKGLFQKLVVPPWKYIGLRN